MAASRHLSRIIALQSLYEWDFRGQPIEGILSRNLKEYERSLDDSSFVERLVSGVLEKRETVDDLIIKAAPEWPIEQVAVIDKTILRLGIYELLFEEEIPPKVAINESVELAKAFGGENSSKFINGVLGTIYRASPRYRPEEDHHEKAVKQMTEDGGQQTDQKSDLSSGRLAEAPADSGPSGDPKP